MSAYFPVNQIVAVDSKFGIGIKAIKDKGVLPWSLPEEFKYYLRVTTEATSDKPISAWVMGRKSYDLIFRDMPEILAGMRKDARLLKVVLSRNVEGETPKKMDEDVYFCTNWKEVQEVLNAHRSKIFAAWNIGGPAVYTMQTDPEHFKERMKDTKIYITKIKKDYNCDMFFPAKWIFDRQSEFLEEMLELQEDNEEGGVEYSCRVYKFLG